MCYPSTEVLNLSLTSPPCPLFVPVSPGSIQPCPVLRAAGRREAANPLAPSDPVSHCQFSFILESLDILETLFCPSDRSESGHGYRRDSRGARRHETHCSWGVQWRNVEGNFCVDGEAMIELMQSANYIYEKKKWKIKNMSFSGGNKVWWNVVQIYK